jgi:O-antigen/teichoic acid export membrane protein
LKLSNKHIILADQALFSGTNFLMTLIIARLLGVSEFGVYAGIVLVIHLLVSGISAWIIQPFQVFYHNKNQDAREYTSFVFLSQLILSLFVVASVVLIASLFYEFSLWSAAFALGFIFHDFGRKYLLATNQVRKTFILDLLVSIGFFVVIAAFYFLANHQLSSLFLYLSLAYVAPFIYTWTVSNMQMLSVSAFKTYLPKHLNEGKWLFMSALTQWWSGNLFVVASGLYLGAAALGALRLAQSLMGVLNIILQSFENYVLPQTAAKLQDGLSLGTDYLVDLTRKAALLFLPILMLSFLFSFQIMEIAGGKDFSEYDYALKGLSILYVFVFVSQPIRLMIRAMLLNQHFFVGYLISLAMALLLSNWLLSEYALMGAIIGLIASQFILIVYWSVILHYKSVRLWKSFISF